MKKNVNGYKVLDEQVKQGGQAAVAVASKDGKTYFIKAYNDFRVPEAPLQSDYPGMPLEFERAKQFYDEQKKRHQRFVNHFTRLKSNLRLVAQESGNSLPLVDFFEEDGLYYSASLSAGQTRVAADDIQYLPRNVQQLILLTAAHSLVVAHRHNIIHGDIKPDNYLICLLPGGNLSARLIDFEGGWVKGSFDRTFAHFDPLFRSPEYRSFSEETAGDADLAPGVKTDVFSLGVLFHYWLTGDYPKPVRDTGEGFLSPAAMLARDGELLLNERLSYKMRRIISKMLVFEDYRLSAEEVFLALQHKEGLLPDKINVNTSYPTYPDTTPDKARREQVLLKVCKEIGAKKWQEAKFRSPGASVPIKAGDKPWTCDNCGSVNGAHAACLLCGLTPSQTRVNRWLPKFSWRSVLKMGARALAILYALSLLVTAIILFHPDRGPGLREIGATLDSRAQGFTLPQGRGMAPLPALPPGRLPVYPAGQWQQGRNPFAGVSFSARELNVVQAAEALAARIRER